MEKKKDVEKRSTDNLRGKEPKINEREEDGNTSRNIEVRKKHVLAKKKHSKREDIFKNVRYRSMKKLKQDFHQIQTKFAHTSLINGITINSLTPSGPKYSGSIMVYKEKHDKDSVI